MPGQSLISRLLRGFCEPQQVTDREIKLCCGRAFGASGNAGSSSSSNTEGSSCGIRHTPPGSVFAHARPSNQPHIAVRNKAWVQADEGHVCVEEVTPIDSISAVLNTVVAVSVLIPEPVQFDVLKAALQSLIKTYPLLCGRLLSIDSPAARALKSEDSSSPAEPCSRGSDAWMSERAAAFSPGFLLVSDGRVPLVEVSLEGMDLGAAQAITRGRTGHRMTSDASEALPCYLQSLDPLAMQRGDGTEAMVKVQLSHVNNGCIVGLTVSHVVADGFTATFIMNELSRLYTQHLQAATHSQARATQPPVCFSRTALQPRAVAAALAAKGCSRTKLEGVQRNNSLAGVGGSTAGAMAYGPSSQELSRFARLTMQVKPSDDTLRSAFGSIRSAGCALHQAFTHLGAGVVMGQVTTLCLHVPKCDLEALKAACGGWLMAWGPMPSNALPLRLSSHDVTAALLWLVICHVRGRPLPCQPLSSEKQAWGCYTPLLEELHHRTFGITADLRHNCSDSINLSGGSDKQGQQQQHSEPDAQQQEGQAHSSGAVKPVVYLGNASCALQVRGDTSEGDGSVSGSGEKQGVGAHASSSSKKKKKVVGAEATLELGGADRKDKSASSAPLTGSVNSASLFPCAWSPGEAAQLTTQWLEAHVQSSLASTQAAPSGTVLALVSSAASRVRNCVDSFRSLPGAGALVLSSFTNHACATRLQKTASIAKFIAQYDGFLTSWSHFPLNSASFGAPSVAAVQPIIHPMAPWSAIAVNKPSENNAPQQQQPQPDSSSNEDGGVLLYMTLPTMCVERVKTGSAAALLRNMAPNARWL